MTWGYNSVVKPTLFFFRRCKFNFFPSCKRPRQSGNESLQFLLAIFQKTPFLAILSPFAPTYGWPLDPTSAFIDKNVITGCCCNDIYGEKAIPGCFHPNVLPSSAICLKIQFFGHLPPFVPTHGRPLNPTSAFIDKNVITGGVIAIRASHFATKVKRNWPVFHLKR